MCDYNIVLQSRYQLCLPQFSRSIYAYFSVVVTHMLASDVNLYLSPNSLNITFIYLCIYESLAVLAGCRLERNVCSQIHGMRTQSNLG